jgi:hypothetical protein
MSHLVLKRDGVVVGLAQAKIFKLPVIRAGFAYVRWGPIWRKRGESDRTEVFRQCLRALKSEYAGKRGLLLRVYPIAFAEDSPEISKILEQEGYFESTKGPDRTLYMDLTSSLDELKSGMRAHWKRELKVAEKGNLEIVEGSDDATFESFISIYREMVDRKRFVEPNNINEFRRIQERLPANFKMKVLLTRVDGRVCAGLVCSAIGNTAVYLFGATGSAGLRARGSYLLHWKLIQKLRETGVTTYDLNGINPVTNPGTYKFKSDLSGDNGRDLHFLGRFDASTSSLSRLCVGWGQAMQSFHVWLKKRVAA